MANIAPHHWEKTRGTAWSALQVDYNRTVTRKDLTHPGTTHRMQAELEQGSVFSVMGKMIVIHVIPESDLAVGELRMILSRVATHTGITWRLKQWDTSSFSNVCRPPSMIGENSDGVDNKAVNEGKKLDWKKRCRLPSSISFQVLTGMLWMYAFPMWLTSSKQYTFSYVYFSSLLLNSMSKRLFSFRGNCLSFHGNWSNVDPGNRKKSD